MQAMMKRNTTVSSASMPEKFSRRQAGRPTGRAIYERPADHQPQDCQGPRPYRPAPAARPRRRGDRVKRREFITLLGGATAWPLTAGAQQTRAMRRIGILAQGAANDPETAARLTAFVQGLQELGWSIGRNARIEYRWADGDMTLIRKHAAELLAFEPDVIMAADGLGGRPLLD